MKFTDDIGLGAGRGRGEEDDAKCKQPCQFADDGILFCIAVIGKEEYRDAADYSYHFIPHAGIIIGAERDLYFPGTIQGEVTQNENGC